MHSEAFRKTDRAGKTHLHRNALLASVAAAALLLAAANHAHADCVTTGVTWNCTGNLLDGVPNAPSNINTIIVHDVTSNIKPLPNKDGIAIWRSAGDVTVNSDLTKPGGGTYGISVSGGEFAGIYASSHTYYKQGGSVFVTSTGAIASENGSGIFAKSDGVVSVTSRGAIQAAIAGIDAISKNKGNVTVRNYGDLTGIINSSTGVVGLAENGIRAQSDYGTGAVYVKNVGNIRSLLTGIDSISFSGTSNVNNEGDITSTSGSGITSSGGGAADAVTNKGNITAGIDGIFAAGGAVLTVTSTGNISSTNGRGIYARGGTVLITNNVGNAPGSVHSFSDAIYAKAISTGIDISSTGNVTSDSGIGIKAILLNGYPGSIGVTSTGGTITAKNDGIRAQSSAQNGVSVVSNSNIVSSAGNGILASRSNRSVIDAVTVTSSGTITANMAGIAVTNANGDMSIRNEGAITTTSGFGVSAKGGDFAGNIAIKNYGAITGFAGIYANDIKGNASVINTASIQAQQSYGVRVLAGTTASLTNSGTISAKYRAIWAEAGGNITVTTTGNVTSTKSEAIFARENGAGTIDVKAGTTGNPVAIKAAGAGILTESASSAKTTVINYGAINAGGAGVRSANSSSGTIEITNTGNIHAGENATSNPSDKSRFYARGISATAATGGITITNEAAGAVRSDTSSGIVAWSGGANNVDVINAGTVEAFRTGIYAYAKSGQVSIVNTGAVTAENDQGYFHDSPDGHDKILLAGLKGISNTGTVTLTDSAAITAGMNGIYGKTSGDVNITLASTGSVTTLRPGSGSYRGIFAATTGGRDGAGDIAVKSYGVINAADVGIAARGFAKGDVAVIVNNTTSPYAVQSVKEAVYGRNQYGAVTINSTGNIKSTGGWGLAARAFGYGKYTNKAEVTSNGSISAHGYGIEVFSRAGTASVNSTGDITTTSLTGIRAGSGGSADVSIASVGNIDLVNQVRQVTVSGWLPDPADPGYYYWGYSTVIQNSDLRYGIFASSNGGKVTVDSTGDISTAHSATGLRASSWYDGTVNIINRGEIHAAASMLTGGPVSNPYSYLAESGEGIYARSRDAAITITSTGKVTSDSATAIHARSEYAGDITITSKAALSAGKYGVWTRTYGGAVDITSEADITGKAGGIYAEAEGDGAVTVKNKANIASSDGNGIAVKVNEAYGTGSAANVAVLNGSAGVAGHKIDAGLAGISVVNLGSGDVDVTNEDSIHAGIGATGPGGLNAHAIHIEAAEGKVSVINHGALVSDTAGGVFVRSVTGSISVQNTGAVTAKASAGIFAASDAAGNVEVQNEGVVNAAATGIAAASSGNGNVLLENHAAVTAGANGIFGAAADGILTVNSTGDITASAGYGIVALGEGTGVVSVTSSGALLSKYAGIYARSLGAVTVSGSGTVTSLEASAIQVLGTGDLTVKAEGAITGAADFAGVEFGATGQGEDGAANTLSVSTAGDVRNAGGLNDFAIRARSGNEAVTNAGTVFGSVDLGSGSNSFLNAAGGRFTMGRTVNLGTGNSFTNSGWMSVGLSGTVASVSMTGNLIQTSGGIWAVDIDGQANAADLITVSGTADLAGTVALNAITKPGPKQEFLIMEADGGVTDSGLVLQDTAATKLQLQYRSSENPGASAVASALGNGLDPVRAVLIDQVWLGVTTDFVVDGLNPNQNAAATNLNQLVSTDPGGVTPVIEALAQIPDTPTYRKALDELLPDPYIHAHMAMADVMSAGLFSDMLISCKTRDGAYAYIAQDQCGWMQTGGTYLKRDAAGMDPGSEETGWWYSGGVQAELSDTLHLGVGGRYERVSQDVQTSHTEGNRGDLGAALTYDSGPLLLASSVSAGRSWLDTDRHVSFNGFSGTARGDSDNSYVRGKLRGAYLFDFGAWYLKPLADLDATWLTYGDVKEEGGAGAALRIDSSDKTMLSASPKLEIGGQWELANGTILRPYASAGATFYSDTDFGVISRFRDAPAGSPSFRTDLEMDDIIANVSLGLDMFATNGTSLRVFYDGSFGETTMMHTGGLRAAMEF